MTPFSRAVFDMVDKVVAAGAEDEVWDDYLGLTKLVGLTASYLAAIPARPDAPLKFYGSRLPRKFLDGYAGNELYAGDKVTAAALTRNRSFEWRLSDWSYATLTALQKRWREHLEIFGIADGVCVLDYSPIRNMMLVTCGAGPVLSIHDRLALFFLGQEVIHRLCDFAAFGTVQADTLSRREQQCLQWAAAGKTDWEIGQILSLSEKTVNVYIDRAKTKFGVKSRAQAIVFAARSGLIVV